MTTIHAEGYDSNGKTLAKVTHDIIGGNREDTGRRFAIELMHKDSRIWRVRVEGVDLETGAFRDLYQLTRVV